MKQKHTETYFFIMMMCLALGFGAFVLNETAGVGSLVLQVIAK